VGAGPVRATEFLVAHDADYDTLVAEGATIEARLELGMDEQAPTAPTRSAAEGGDPATGA
jgi:hypothetical protein